MSLEKFIPDLENFRRNVSFFVDVMLAYLKMDNPNLDFIAKILSVLAAEVSELEVQVDEEIKRVKET